MAQKLLSVKKKNLIPILNERQTESAESLLKIYCDYLTVERGLSPNTVSSYTFDIEKLLGYCSSQKKNLTRVKEADLVNFLHLQAQAGLSARSLARLVSSIKSFYRFLQLENYTGANPASRLNSPALWFSLPQVLTEEEVVKLLEQPDISQPQGLRDRAMLEILYGSGLRVSELVKLELKDIRLKEGFVVCKGKGNKERIVPIGRQAIHWLNTYLQDIRPGWDKKDLRWFFSPDGVQVLPARGSGNSLKHMARGQVCLIRFILIF